VHSLISLKQWASYSSELPYAICSTVSSLSSEMSEIDNSIFEETNYYKFIKEFKHNAHLNIIQYLLANCRLLWSLITSNSRNTVTNKKSRTSVRNWRTWLLHQDEVFVNQHHMDRATKLDIIISTFKENHIARTLEDEQFLETRKKNGYNVNKINRNQPWHSLIFPLWYSISLSVKQ
jgi:hypothetical protein